MHYYVNTHPGSHGRHEVHHEGCADMPRIEYRQYLGMFETTKQAIAMARIVYEKVINCKHCTKVKPAHKAHARKH